MHQLCAECEWPDYSKHVACAVSCVCVFVSLAAMLDIRDRKTLVFLLIVGIGITSFIT